MLGTDARRILAEQGHHVLPTDVGPAATGGIAPLDITDLHGLRAVFGEFRPDLVLHGAAYTNVDGCERDPDTAHRVNALGTWAVAAAAEEVGAALVAVSTDFVFDGEKGDALHGVRRAQPHQPLRRVQAGRREPGPAGLPPDLHRPHVLAVRGPRQELPVHHDATWRSPSRNCPSSRDQIGTPTYTVDLVERHRRHHRVAPVRHLPCQQRRRVFLGRLRPRRPAKDGPGPRPRARHHVRRVRPDVRLAHPPPALQRDAPLRAGTAWARTPCAPGKTPWTTSWRPRRRTGRFSRRRPTAAAAAVSAREQRTPTR